LKRGQGGLVPQPVEARAIQFRSPIAIIKIEVVVREMQVGLTRDILAPASQLLVNRLLLLLTGVETRA
jgi:hypothetical protein